MGMPWNIQSELVSLVGLCASVGALMCTVSLALLRRAAR
jgi:hypothetical protein